MVGLIWIFTLETGVKNFGKPFKIWGGKNWETPFGVAPKIWKEPVGQPFSKGGSQGGNTRA